LNLECVTSKHNSTELQERFDQLTQKELTYLYTTILWICDASFPQDHNTILFF